VKSARDQPDANRANLRAARESVEERRRTSMSTSAADPATPDALSHAPQRWRVLVACCLMGLAAAAVPGLWALVPAATPEVFGASALKIQVETNVGVLVFVAFMLGGGTLGDLLGRRRLLLGAGVGLVVATVVSALSPHLVVFMIGRLALALCGGIIVSLAIATLRVVFQPNELPRALGVYFGLLGLAQLGLPALFPLVTQTVSWRPTFLLAIVFGSVGAWWTWKYVPESRAPGGTHRHDAIGTAAWSVVLLALLFALSGLVYGPYAAIYLLVGLVVGVIGLGVLIWLAILTRGAALGRELPFKRALSIALAIGVIINVAFAGAVTQLVNFFLSIQLDRPVVMALKLAPLGVAILGGGLLAARLAGRFPIRHILSVALLVMALAVAALAVVNPRIAYGWLLVPILLLGLTYSLVNTYVVDIVLNLVPRDLAGSAGGVSEATGRIGGTIGPIVTGALLLRFGGDLFTARLRGVGRSSAQIKQAIAAVNKVLQSIHPGASVPDLTGELRTLIVGYAQAYTAGLARVFLVIAALCLVSAVAVWVGMPQRPASASSPAGDPTPPEVRSQTLTPPPAPQASPDSGTVA
jgi:predicted MFS family arabinose efflux permease